MEIKLVKSAGFCFGVERAIDLAVESSKKYNNKKIFTIGHIIHNNDVVNYLEKRQVEAITPEEAVNIKDSVVILRSHGVEKELLETVKKNNNIIVDAICPYVKKIHKYVDKLKNENYFVIIVGDKGHPEVNAIYSFSDKDNSIIIADEKDHEFIKIFEKKIKKIGIVAQTTQEFDNFEKICKRLLPLKIELRIFNTICDATSKRQKESIEVAKESDIMIVIGGKHSANTKRLKEICEKIQPDTYHIENEKELEKKWFDNKKTVGITAGASTPSTIIDNVLKAIKNQNFHSKII